MKRFFIYLSYDGKNYCGWQSQPNGPGVQQKLETCLSIMLREKISLTGAGRTDAGVHAALMVAHFDWGGEAMDFNRFVPKLNSFLPDDIAVHKILEVRKDAHARFDAFARTYKYYVTVDKDPFRRDFSWRPFRIPDFEKMNKAAKILFQYEDFTSFSKLHTDVKNNNCKITEAYWKEERPGIWCFTIRANRFLRNMVRAIVGTLFEVGWGRMTEEGFKKTIEAKDRSQAGNSVPAKALFLVNIEYPPDIIANENR